MSDRAVMHCDETRRPVSEKAEQAVDLFRSLAGDDPIYLRVGLHDYYRLTRAGFDDVPLVADACVQKGCFYAVWRG